MANNLKLEKIEDLLTIDQSTLKAAEAKAVIKKVKQLLKVSNIKDGKADEIAKDYKYTGVSVVGNRMVILKFDLDSKEARVTDIIIDSRDTRGKNHMATFKASDKLDKLAKEQKDEQD